SHHRAGHPFIALVGQGQDRIALVVVSCHTGKGDDRSVAVGPHLRFQRPWIEDPGAEIEATGLGPPGTGALARACPTPMRAGPVRAGAAGVGTRAPADRRDEGDLVAWPQFAT